MMRDILLRALLIMAIAAVPSSGCHAETKVVERSAKKAPVWLGGAPDGFLVVTVDAASLAEAQKRAVDEIAARIIHSVASHIDVDQVSVMSETLRNDDIESLESYSRTARIRSANLPFLKGVSLSKAADIYWEKLRDKKYGTERYEYSVKYPFPESERRELEAAFEALDKSKMDELERLEHGIGSISAVEEIRAAITSLDALGEYFFDNVRTAQVKGLRTRYNDLYKSLGIDGSVTSPGVVECGLMVAGESVSCGVAPKAESNCASNIHVAPVDGRFRIEYDTIDCLPEEDNWLSVSFRINGRTVERRFVLTCE